MSVEENLEAVVVKGFRILNREERYNTSLYFGPSEAAEAEFRAALQLRPDCYSAYLGLGQCYAYRPNQYEDAIRAFEQARLLHPEEPAPYYHMGLTYLHAGERNLLLFGLDPFKEALKCFETALSLGYVPKAWLFNHIGTNHFRMGSYTEAVEWFEKSFDTLKKESGWIPSTFFLAAQANENLGLFAEAIKWYERYIEEGKLGDVEEITQRIKFLESLPEMNKQEPS